MKKYLSLMLSIVLLLCAVIPVSAATEEYVSSSALDSALVTHFDFNGTSLENATTGCLRDRATGGSSDDSFTAYAGVTNNKDGTITYTGKTDGIKTVFGDTRHDATSGNDIKGNTTGQFTFMISFKVTGDGKTSGGYRDCFRISSSSSNHLFRFFSGNCSGTDVTTATKDYFIQFGALSATKVATLACDGNNLYTFAFSMKYNEATSVWDVAVYYSKDGGTTYTQVLNTTAANSKDYWSAAMKFSLGNRNVQGTSTIYTFDDFRIYNKALSLPEIKYEVPGVTGAVLHGVQTSNVSDTYSVRFVGSIESKDYHEVGFKVTAQNGAYKWDVSAETVFSSLNANTDKGLESYTAKSLRGSDSGYLYALSINEIPTKDNGNDLTVTFIVTPYSIENEGDDPVPGTAYTIVYKAGVYQSSAVYTAPTT